jgi:hypothetical protein
MRHDWSLGCLRFYREAITQRRSYSFYHPHIDGSGPSARQWLGVIGGVRWCE